MKQTVVPAGSGARPSPSARQSSPARNLAAGAALMLAACLPAPLCAQSAPEGCDPAQGAAGCVRVLACIGDDGRWFDGHTAGLGSGRLFGAMSDGVTCTGTWTNSAALGLGQALFVCSDGTDGQVVYARQDGDTGTAIGQGVLSTGEQITAWSGANVLDYLTKTGAADRAALPCTDAGIPIS